MDGGILLEVAEVETVPVWLALFEADEEGFVGRSHQGADVLDEPEEDFHFLCVFSIHIRQVLWG